MPVRPAVVLTLSYFAPGDTNVFAGPITSALEPVHKTERLSAILGSITPGTLKGLKVAKGDFSAILTSDSSRQGSFSINLTCCPLRFRESHIQPFWQYADPPSNRLEFVQAKPSTDGTQPGTYAVEHTAPGFLGSLALCVTQGSVSQPLMNAYDGCHVTILL